MSSKMIESLESSVVTTTRGLMDKSLLDENIEVFEDDNELTHVIEYRAKGEEEVIHRSVHVQLKKNVVVESVAASF